MKWWPVGTPSLCLRPPCFFFSFSTLSIHPLLYTPHFFRSTVIPFMPVERTKTGLAWNPVPTKFSFFFGRKVKKYIYIIVLDTHTWIYKPLPWFGSYSTIAYISSSRPGLEGEEWLDVSAVVLEEGFSFLFFLFQPGRGACSVKTR